MKALTRRSRAAILVFLSVITLTLVARIALPQQNALRETSFKQNLTYNLVRTENKSESENILTRGTILATQPKQFSNTQTVLAFMPWTVLASPRAPPA